MVDMSIAHFGTTLIESPPSAGEDQASIPMTGDLGRTDEFLRILGAEIYIKNMYPFGRQFIYKRGEVTDPDYFEKDTFTSYTAVPLPETDLPRVAETIFRLPHRAARQIAVTLMDRGLIKPLSGYSEFVNGDLPALFFVGPDRQQYELIESSNVRHQNHRIYIWTNDKDLERHRVGYAENFGIRFQNTEDFYGIGTAHLLVRKDPGVTIALLTPKNGAISPKHSFDIFKDAGYSHFRLGSLDKSLVLSNAEEAFPDGGGEVAYVHFQNSYLELVQIGAET
ncbi:MAG: hypothetical protein HN738_17245 [Gammaproteobacteria bacterium]|nr:hypothetical protein [Gammaproteobacteria bacterium]